MMRRFWFVLFLVAACWGCAPKELPSIHVFVTADIQGVFWARPEPRYGNEMTGGLAILKSFLDKQTTPFLLLEGGNWFGQTPEGTLTQGDYFNEIAATLPFAGRLFTDKDLAYGWRSLSGIIQHSPAPFILSNVTLSNQKLPAGSKPWLLEEVGGYKVGVIGLVSSQALARQQRVGNLKILPEKEALEQTVQLLREKGAQAIVLLSALGNLAGKNALTDSELAQEIGGIDVIISSTLEREEPEVNRVGQTLIVYPGSRLDSVGKITFSFYPNGELAETQFEDVVLYRRDFGEDTFVAEQIAEIRRTTRSQMSRPVGKSEEVLEGRLDGESALGDWAAECMRNWAKADAAVLNSSSLRDVLPAGTVTQYDLYKLYPYADHITYLTMKGAALKQALEEGLLVPDNFAQIAGLKVQYRPGAPSGKKISAITVKGTPLQPTASYKVAVTDHVLAGGAGHDGFIDSLEFKNTQVEMSTVLRLCLAGKPVTPPEGKRWQVVK